MNTWTWKRSHGSLLEDHLDRPRSPCFSWAWRCPSRASGPCCRCQWRRPPGTWVRRSAEPPAGPGLTDEYTTREVADQPAFSHRYLCETFFAVPPSVVAFKLELSGRPRKLLDTVRVQLVANRYQAELKVSWGWQSLKSGFLTHLGWATWQAINILGRRLLNKFHSVCWRWVSKHLNGRSGCLFVHSKVSTTFLTQRGKTKAPNLMQARRVLGSSGPKGHIDPSTIHIGF